MILVTLAAIDQRKGRVNSYLQPFAIGMSIVIAMLFLVIHIFFYFFCNMMFNFKLKSYDKICIVMGVMQMCFSI